MNKENYKIRSFRISDKVYEALKSKKDSPNWNSFFKKLLEVYKK